MSSFFLCSEINCNRKYKTKNKLIDHLLQIHKIIAGEINEPVEITKENKKNVENKRNNIKQKEQREALIKEAEVKQQLELIAKREAEDLYRQQLIEKYKLIEEQKLKQQEEQLMINKNNFEKLKLLMDERLKREEKLIQEEKLIAEQIDFDKSLEEQFDVKPDFNEVMGPLMSSIQEEYLSNPNLSGDLMNTLSIYKDGSKHDFIEQAEKKPLCSICLDDDANTAVVPCGHSNFCYECISSHHINNQNKVCPMCRQEIMMVVKLYI